MNSVSKDARDRVRILIPSQHYSEARFRSYYAAATNRQLVVSTLGLLSGLRTSSGSDMKINPAPHSDKGWIWSLKDSTDPNKMMSRSSIWQPSCLSVSISTTEIHTAAGPPLMTSYCTTRIKNCKPNGSPFYLSIFKIGRCLLTTTNFGEDCKSSSIRTLCALSIKSHILQGPGRLFWSGLCTPPTPHLFHPLYPTLSLLHLPLLFLLNLLQSYKLYNVLHSSSFPPCSCFCSCISSLEITLPPPQSSLCCLPYFVWASI